MPAAAGALHFVNSVFVQREVVIPLCKNGMSWITRIVLPCSGLDSSLLPQHFKFGSPFQELSKNPKDVAIRVSC